ncbi:MAG: hypothetical protein ACE14V_07675 [bacterium]
MGVYKYPRATGDIDIWVEVSASNSEKIYESLKTFGAPLSEITKSTFTEKGIILQIGIPPRRIDIITHIDGVVFKDAYKTKKMVKLDNIKVPFLSKTNLIKNKESTGRDKDKLDALILKKKNKRL